MKLHLSCRGIYTILKENKKEGLVYTILLSYKLKYVCMYTVCVVKVCV